jgi:hypothetical protein
VSERWPVTREDIRRRNVQVLLNIAETEDAVARTFERLAETGRPEDRVRRADRARNARAGAAAAREIAARLHQRG